MDHKELRRNYSALSVLVCGDMCLDKNYIGGYSGFSRELEHLPIFRADMESCNPGGGGNLASCFSALGARTTVTGVWGGKGDFNKCILESEFRERNIDISGMVEGSRTPTYGKAYLRNGSHIYRLDLTSEAVTEQTEAQIADRVERLIHKVNFVACADYEEANNYGVCSEKVLKTITKNPLPKFGTSRKRIRRFNGFNHLLLNTTELIEQSRPDKSLEISDVVKDFLTRMEIDEIIITMGGKGATAFSQSGSEPAKLESLFVESIELTGNIDPCGCGDMFYAAYSSSIMAGYNTETSLRIANAAARVVARKLFGTGQAAPEEIAEEYSVLYPDKN